MKKLARDSPDLNLKSHKSSRREVVSKKVKSSQVRASKPSSTDRIKTLFLISEH